MFGRFLNTLVIHNYEKRLLKVDFQFQNLLINPELTY